MRGLKTKCIVHDFRKESCREFGAKLLHLVVENKVITILFALNHHLTSRVIRA